MKRKYIIGALITFLVIVVNQSFIQYWLYKKHEDAKIINLSGRQRMLSQKICLGVYNYKFNNGSLEETKNDFRLWKNTHYSLLNLNPYSEEIEQAANTAVLLNKLTPQVLYVENVLKHINTLDINRLKNNQTDYLIKMDEIVYLYEQEANRKLEFVIIIEIILAVIALIILTMELIFIYKPISDHLLKQNIRFKEIAWQQSHEVRKPVSNILLLCNLIKNNRFETEQERQMQVEFLVKSTKELDDIIKKIVQIAETK